MFLRNSDFFEDKTNKCLEISRQSGNRDELFFVLAENQELQGKVTEILSPSKGLETEQELNVKNVKVHKEYPYIHHMVCVFHVFDDNRWAIT